MKAFVTGASGFIGTSVIRRLRSAGHSVTALVRSAERAATLRDLGATVIVGDILTTLFSATDDIDTVFHLASEPTESQGTILYAETDKRGVDKLIQTWPSAHFIYPSTAWVYRSSQDWIDEKSPLGPTTGIGRVKQAVEERVRQSGKHTLFRIAMIYPGGAFDRQFVLPANRWLYFCPGPATNFTAVISICDVTEALVTAAEKRIYGIFNLADDHPITWKMLFHEVASALHRRDPLVVPNWLVRAVVGHDLANFAAAELKISNAAAKQAGFRIQYPDFRSGFLAAMRG